MANNYQKTMKENSYIISSSQDTFSTFSIPMNNEWHDFCDAWNHLLLDQYMNDGGTYRYRRYSAFELDVDAQSLIRVDHAPYEQSSHINTLNGGVKRYYEPVEQNFAKSLVLEKILFGYGKIINSVAKHSRFNVKLHPYRIIAKENTFGEPAPEGLHKDGVDFVTSLMIKRVNVTGGESIIANTEKEIINRHMMINPGEFVLTNDKELYHGVTSLAIEDKLKSIAYRDVLVIAYELI